MKIWVDDVREAPHGYFRCYSVNQAIQLVTAFDTLFKQGIEEYKVEEVDCDHDMGDYFYDGGDGTELVNWLVKNGFMQQIVIHTMNPVGRQNMLAIIKYGAKEPEPEKEQHPEMIAGAQYAFIRTKGAHPEIVTLNHYDKFSNMCSVTSLQSGRYFTTHVKRLRLMDELSV